MKRRTERRLAEVLAFLLILVALFGGLGAGLATAGAAPGLPAQTATTVPVTGAAPVTTVSASAPPVETAVPGSPTTVPESDQVGDPAADRRIRNIILALGALALIVLITTIIFWRKTKPVPVALEGLRRLGSRSGRRTARAVEAPGVEPPSVAGDGVTRAGVDVRPATVAVADGGVAASVERASAGVDRPSSGVDRASSGVEPAVAPEPSVAGGVPAEVPPAPSEVAASSDVSSRSDVASDVSAQSEAAAASDVAAAADVAAASDGAAAADVAAASDVAASSDGRSSPAAEVVSASAPPPAPGTSLREDG